MTTFLFVCEYGFFSPFYRTAFNKIPQKREKNKPEYKLKMNDEEKKVRSLQNSDRNQFGEYINFIIFFFYHFLFSIFPRTSPNEMNVKALNFYLLCNFFLFFFFGSDRINFSFHI